MLPRNLALAPPHALGDHEFIAAASAVGGFGGFFFDEAGNPTVYLRDTAMATAVDAELRARFLVGSITRGRHAAVNTGPIRYRAAQFDFIELAQFRVTAERLLDQEPTAVSIDIDETRNRIEIAVSGVDARQRLADAIRAAGVPADAFVVSLAKGSQLTAGPGDSLSSGFNPIPGGVTINDINECTLGFNINWGGRSAFLTASHCTHRFGSLTSPSSYGQPSYFPAGSIGVEVADPAPWQNTNDCVWAQVVAVRVCRYSDVAVIQAQDTVANSRFSVGYVVRTLASGSVVINQSMPRQEIVGKKTPVYAGEWMDRVGISSGWTSAQVSNTCTTEYFYGVDSVGTNIKLWCQFRLYGAPLPGDSGGPVTFYHWCGIFRTRPDGTECTSVAGTTVARIETDGHRTVVSPIPGIEADLGTSLLVAVVNQP